MRIVLATLGLVTAIGASAIAWAGYGASEPSCCGTSNSCCPKQASCCDKVDPTITCPMTGEQIKVSDCPLCKSRK